MSSTTTTYGCAPVNRLRTNNEHGRRSSPTVDTAGEPPRPASGQYISDCEKAYAGLQGLVGSSFGHFGLSPNSSHMLSHLRAEGNWFEYLDVYATCVQKLSEANKAACQRGGKYRAIHRGVLLQPEAIDHQCGGCAVKFWIKPRDEPVPVQDRERIIAPPPLRCRFIRMRRKTLRFSDRDIRRTACRWRSTQPMNTQWKARQCWYTWSSTLTTE